MQFRQHGQFKTYLGGQILVSEVVGPWNRELVENWAKYCYPFAKEMSDLGPYVGIAIIRESMMCPPDALESLRRTVFHSTTKLACVGHLIVAESAVEGRDLLAATFAQLYTGLCAHQLFDSYAPAQEYAAELLRAAWSPHPVPADTGLNLP